MVATDALIFQWSDHWNEPAVVVLLVFLLLLCLVAAQRLLILPIVCFPLLPPLSLTLAILLCLCFFLHVSRLYYYVLKCIFLSSCFVSDFYLFHSLVCLLLHLSEYPCPSVSCRPSYRS